MRRLPVSARVRCLAVAFAVFGALPAATPAAPIVGKLGFRGDLSLTATTIDFLPAGGGSGTIAIDPATQSGSFTAVAGTSGNVLDLSGIAIGSPVSVANFLTLSAAPTFQFTLTFIAPGVFLSAPCTAAPAVGQTCSPSGSAFNDVNTPGGGSVLIFSVQGTALNTATGETSHFAGTFTTQFAQFPYQVVLNLLATGGSVSAGYSAELTATTP